MRVDGFAKKTRSTMKLGGFKGADLSSSVLRADTAHAVRMQNLISRDGANHKRYGWHSCLRLDGRINGIFPFSEQDADVLILHAGETIWRVCETKEGTWQKTMLSAGMRLSDTTSQSFYRDGRLYLVGCGELLAYGLFDGSYQLKRMSDIAYVPTTTDSIDAIGVTDQVRAALDEVNLLTAWRKNTLVGLTAPTLPSNATTTALKNAYRKNRIKTSYRLDALCGEVESVCVSFSGVTVWTNYHLYGKEEEITYANTKEWSYDGSGTLIFGADGYLIGYQREGEALIEGNGGFCTYMEVESEDGTDLTIRWLPRDGYYAEKNAALLAFAQDIGIISTTYNDGYTYLGGEGHTLGELFRVSVEGDVLSFWGLFPSSVGEDSNITVTFRQNEARLPSCEGKSITATVDGVTLSAGEGASEGEINGATWRVVEEPFSNWRLTASGRSASGYVTVVLDESGEVLFENEYFDGGPLKKLTKQLNSATVGTLFGYDGGWDRLFLAGRGEEIGTDRWSEADDFTYFPDTNVMYIGGNESAVTGYLRLSDGVLGIFKDQAHGYPTIYYRTAASKTVTDASGISVPAQYFPVVAGTIGEPCLTPHAIGVLAGDPLFVSPRGVFGAELSENLSSGERYAKERSRAVYEALRKKDLSRAVAVVHDGRYYLSPGDGSCYVADSRYRASFEGSPDSGYEWWVWDNVPATCFAIYKGNLTFGDAQGYLCVFDETYADRYMVPLDTGELMVAQAQEHELSPTVSLTISKSAVFAEGVPLADGDRLIIRCALYEYLCRVDIKDGVCHFSDVQRPAALFDGAEVLAGSHSGNLDLENLEGILARGSVFCLDEVDFATNTFSIWRDGKLCEPQDGLSWLCRPLQGEALTVAVDAAEQSFSLRDDAGDTLTLVAYEGENFVYTFPPYIEAEIARTRPVVAEWYTPVLDMGTSGARKTMTRFSLILEPGVTGGVQAGFATGQQTGALCETGGAAFDFEALDFNLCSFDAAGFAGALSRPLTVRNFNFIQFVFRSDTANDLTVSELEVEYKINQKNRGYY